MARLTIELVQDTESAETSTVFCTWLVGTWRCTVVATHCHIDDPNDVLDLWDLHGSLYFPESQAPVVATGTTTVHLSQWNCRICNVLTNPLET